MIEIPERGFAACLPPADDWPAAAAGNRESLGSLKGFGFVDEWRKEVWEAAGEYSRALGITAPVFDPAKPSILSGHQPYPFHPGVLYKYLLLSRLPEEKCNALWVSVDTDPSMGFPARIPSFTAGPETVTLKMQPGSSGNFYHRAGLERGELESFAEEASRMMADDPQERFGWGREFLKEKLAGDLPEKTADLLLLWRREYAGQSAARVAEVPLTMVCRTGGFFRFAFLMLKRAGDTARAFNGILDAYRAEHKIRSRANPFPDLDVKNGFSETLFWTAEGDDRTPLYAAPDGEGVEIFCGGKSHRVSSPEGLKELMDGLGLELWPRAVALSVMQRICLGDLFLHGAGGARYDRVTNALIGSLFDTEPPAFAAASFTPRPEGLEDPGPKLAELKQQDREMEFHPESYLADPASVKELMERKEKLVAEIKRPGADKKSLGREIKKINDLILAEAEPVREMMRKEIKALKEKNAYYNVVAERELPFFLFPPGSIPAHCP